MRTTLRALAYFRHDLPAIALSLLAIGGMTLCGLLQVYPLAILTDNVFGPFAPAGLISRAFFAIAPHGPVGQVLLLAVYLLLLRITQELLQLSQTHLNIRVGYAGLLRVRCDLFRKLQELGLDFHRARPQGDLIYRLMWDTCGVQTLLNVVSQTMLVSGATLLVMIGILLSVNWRLALVSLCVAPLLWFTTRSYHQILASHAAEAKVAESDLTTAAQRSVSTIALVQAFNREADEYTRFVQSARLSVAAYLKLHRQELIFWLLIGITFGVGGAAVFGYGGYLIARDQQVLHRGGAGMTIGKLTIFLAYLAMLYNPLRSLSGSGAQLASGVAGVKRVFDVLDEQPSVRESPDAVPLPRGPHLLSLRNVGFRYPDGPVVLDGLNAEIAAGEMVAFVGASGAGKTTLLNLLPRFFDPTTGSIALGGRDLKTLRLRDLRHHVALVLQDSILLPATLRENIGFGKTDATDEQITAAADRAGVSAFASALPGAFDTVVTEAGQNLSGGQKQRIAIARALLSDAPILVLDEPTSALDAEQETNLVTTLQQLRGSRTIILVSHRLSTVAGCDTVFLLHEGRVVEQGSYDALLRQGGRFAALAGQHRLEPEPASA